MWDSALRGGYCRIVCQQVRLKLKDFHRFIGAVLEWCLVRACREVPGASAALQLRRQRGLTEPEFPVSATV